MVVLVWGCICRAQPRRACALDSSPSELDGHGQHNIFQAKRSKLLEASTTRLDRLVSGSKVANMYNTCRNRHEALGTEKESTSLLCLRTARTLLALTGPAVLRIGGAAGASRGEQLIGQVREVQLASR
jgi:hypothetical protein